MGHRDVGFRVCIAMIKHHKRKIFGDEIFMFLLYFQATVYHQEKERQELKAGILRRTEADAMDGIWLQDSFPCPA